MSHFETPQEAPQQPTMIAATVSTRSFRIDSPSTSAL
jgi:hypothetical protein